MIYISVLNFGAGDTPGLQDFSVMKADNATGTPIQMSYSVKLHYEFLFLVHNVWK
jgi:hypothetical protein